MKLATSFSKPNDPEKQSQAIEDKRINPNNIEFTIGHHLALRTGLIGSKPSSHPLFLQLQDLYNIVKQKKFKLDTATEAALSTSLYACSCLFLQEADVIVGTVAAALEERSICNITPTIIIGDEFGRVMDLHAIALLACYPKTVNRVFLTDHLQLGLTINDTFSHNIFAPQAKIPGTSHWSSAGFSTFVMTTQVRCPIATAEMLCKVFFESTQDCFRTGDNYREPIEGLQQSINALFHTTKPYIALDVKNSSKVMVGAYQSRKNSVHVNVCLTVLEEIVNVKGLTLEHCQIITPYTAQVRQFECAKEILVRCPGLLSTPVNVNWQELRVCIVDTAQGGERPIIIIDITGTSTIGHLDDNSPFDGEQNRKRMYTALTRSNGIIILVMNSKALEKVWHYKNTKLYKIFHHLHARGCVKKISEDEIYRSSLSSRPLKYS